MGIGTVHVRAALAGAWLLESVMMVAAGACASTQRADLAPGGRDAITMAELTQVVARDAYTAIEALRPLMLRGRGLKSYLPGSPQEPEVFVDGMYFGQLGSLRLLAVSDLAEVRWLDLGAAAVMYGQGHTAGVIDITTRRR